MINKEKKIMNNETNKYILSEEKEKAEKKVNDKNDNYLAMIISRWIVIGMLIGVSIGIYINNIPMSVSFGLSIGIIVGVIVYIYKNK